MTTTNATVIKMQKAAEVQRLDKLYENQVDSELYTDDCDFEKDPTGLFFDLDKGEFYFVDYVTNHSGWKDAFLSQNNAIFMDYVNANDAICNDLETYIELFEQGQQD